MPAVLFVTNSMNKGGAETHIVTMASALMQEGLFVAVASSGGILVNELKKRGILHIEAPLDSRMPHRILRAARILRRAVKKYGFDIIHAHARLAALASRMVVRGGLLKRCLPFDSVKNDAVRFVTTAHLDFRVTPFLRRMSFWGERTLAVSEDLREYLIREYSLSYDTIDLAVNGIDTDRFSKKQLPVAVERRDVKPFEIVHVSRIDKDRAMTAFLLVALMPKLLKKHRVHLTIVGAGELFETLTTRVERVCMLYGECISLVGAKEDVLPYLRRADLAVGVSRAALEAMSCSLPTVLSGNDGYLGIFEKEKLSRCERTNFCCRGEKKPTEEELYADLDTLLSMEQEEREALGQIAREAIEMKYSLAISVKQYLDFYNSVFPYRRKRYNKALILGYHGYQNVGDDALLGKMVEGIRQNAPDAGITVLSRRPKETERNYPVRAVSRLSFLGILRALLSAEVLYVGGGTLLQSGTSHRSLRYYLFVIGLAKLLGKTIVYWGNGIGRLNAKEQRKVAKALATQSVISMRDEHSYLRSALMVAEIPEKKRFFWQENKKTRTILQTADSAVMQEACSEAHVDALLKPIRSAPYFVIATNGCIRGARKGVYEKRLFSALMLAVEKGLVPVFLAMQPKKDLPLAEALSEKLRGLGYESLTLSPTPKEALGVISRAEFVLSSRLHPLIFAAKSSVRAIAYARDDKILSFARCVFGEESVCCFDKREAHRLTEAVLSVLIVKRLPQESALFLPSEEAVREMVARAERLPDELHEALLTLALTKKKTFGIFSRAVKHRQATE